jgi:hypothetical protein
VDPDDTETPFPLLRFNEGDDNVDEMPLWKTMDEMWLEPPPGRICLFVKLTDREYGPYSKLKLLLRGHSKNFVNIVHSS